MFDFFRRHTRALQFLLVLLIFPSFVFFGIQGYSRFAGGDQQTVAKVAGQPITQAEFDSRAARARRPGAPADARASIPKLFETPEMKRHGARRRRSATASCWSPPTSSTSSPATSGSTRAVQERPGVRVAAQPRRQRQPRRAGRARACRRRRSPSGCARTCRAARCCRRWRHRRSRRPRRRRRRSTRCTSSARCRSSASTPRTSSPR